MLNWKAFNYLRRRGYEKKLYGFLDLLLLESFQQLHKDPSGSQGCFLLFKLSVVSKRLLFIKVILLSNVFYMVEEILIFRTPQICIFAISRLVAFRLNRSFLF